MSKVLILGGTSSIEKALEKEHQNDDVWSSTRSSQKLSPHQFYLDLAEENSFENIPVQPYHRIYFLIGHTPLPKDIENQTVASFTIDQNFKYPLLFLRHLLSQKLLAEGGHLLVITSVAGLRGRKLNYVYGASKGGLSIALQGLQQSYPQSAITDVVLGPVYTAAVPEHQSPRFLISQSADIAKRLKKIKRQGRVFVPGYWRLIAVILKAIPLLIFKKLNF
jgi:NADP-dependent 3-hydroxy acid dehydrogenase YdfG